MKGSFFLVRTALLRMPISFHKEVIRFGMFSVKKIENHALIILKEKLLIIQFILIILPKHYGILENITPGNRV